METNQSPVQYEGQAAVQPEEVIQPPIPGMEQHSTGYFDGTYQWQQPQPEGEQEVPAVPEGDPTMDALAEKLGINPDQLGKTQEEIDAAKPEEPPQSVDDWYSQQFAEPEAKQWVENFKKHVGIDIKEAYALINNTAQVTKGLEQWRAEVKTERDLGQLRQEFGQEFDTIMPMVAQEFQRIAQVNPKQAAALDNIDGARYLAAYIRQQKGFVTQPNQQQPQAAPNYQFPNVRQRHGGGQPPSPTIRMSEFVKWSDAEVQSRYQEIVLAKQMGTFINDL